MHHDGATRIETRRSIAVADGRFESGLAIVPQRFLGTGPPVACRERRCCTTDAVIPAAFDEMRTPDGVLRPHYRAFADWLERTPARPHRAEARRGRAHLPSRRHHVRGVRRADAGTERLIPFDLVPRIIPADEWRALEAGLRAARARAEPLPARHLSRPGRSSSAGIIPAEQVLGNAQYRPEMHGVDVPGGIYAHIAGIDIVRADGGRVLRARRQPARAVRRVVHAREPQDDDAALSRAVRARTASRRSQHYPDLLLETLRAVAPRRRATTRRSSC